MLDSYRRILGRPGTAAFSGAALVGRLPISMVGLGLVLLVEREAGSYGAAGAVSAAFVLANAAASVPQGRLLDRRGQGRVLPVLVVAWALGLVATVAAVQAGLPVVVVLVLAALSGAALPQVGSSVRTRWAHTVRGQELQTAFALEAVADETVFLLGPILVTTLATLVDPVAGLAATVVAGLGGTLWFASQRRTEPPAHPRSARSEHADGPAPVRPGIPWATIAPLTVAAAALGVLFGAAEVTTVAFAEEQGNQTLSGPLLAVWALGSLLAGAVTGTITWRRGPLERLRWGALGMLAAMAPLALVPSVAVMAAVLLVGGLAIAPTLIATMSLAEQSLPPVRLTEGMGLLQTGLAAGIAPGAALAGVVIDAAGASPAYLVCVAGGAVALSAALLARGAPGVEDRRAHPLGA